jgi:hypothetical protein
LYKNKNSVLEKPDEQKQAIFNTGNVVGDLACKLFPDGKEVPYIKVGDKPDFDQMITLTKQWIDEGVENIYEGTFNYDGILVMVDILHRGSDGWEMYEVKSSTEVKDVYLHDASIQYYVLKALGLKISKVSIVHINNKYVRGDKLEIEKLFMIADVTDEVKLLQDNIPLYLQEFNRVLDNKETPPNIDIGTHCSNPYDCDAMNHCWAHIPEYSIFDISRLRSNKKFELYQSGIVSFEHLCDEDIMDMSVGQQIQIQSELKQEDIVNTEAIKSFVDSLTYPLYHLDFETFQQAVPLWKGISPFIQIPFQFSVHAELGGGKLEHHEFLAKEGVDPRYELSKALVNAIPQNVIVLAYNMGFEKGVIKKLAEQFPEFGTHLMNIHNNIHDLMIPFQNKDYYAPSMRGSYSIKYVLPALVPEMEKAYKELDLVHNGGEAMQAFARLQDMEDDNEKSRLRESLLRYCELDTMAMVKILEKLRESVR